MSLIRLFTSAFHFLRPGIIPLLVAAAPAIAGAAASYAASRMSNRQQAQYDSQQAQQQSDYNREINAQQLAWAREQQERNEALQREFAQNGIRWKVEDAKAAGLHPLYGITGAGATFSPSAIGVNLSPSVAPGRRATDFSSMGQDLSRAWQAQATEEEREQRKLQTALLLAQIDTQSAQAEALRSQAQRDRLSLFWSNPLTMGQGNWADSIMYGARARGGGDVVDLGNSQGPLTKYKPQEVVRNRPGAPHILPTPVPGFVEQTMGSGPRDKWLYPAMGDQPKDELNMIDYVPFLRENIKHYGWRWLLDMVGASNVADSLGFAWDYTKRAYGPSR